MAVKAFAQHPGKVLQASGEFKYVMAIALDPTTGNKSGIVRCITSRSGRAGMSGNLDRSVLTKISGDSLESFTIGEQLRIEGEDEMIRRLCDAAYGEDADFIGLEDPDLWFDEQNKLIHAYFTIPIFNTASDERSHHDKVRIHLGHAVGKDLDHLKMTEPAVNDERGKGAPAKELSIVPVNSNGIRYNLFESAMKIEGFWFSTVMVAVAEDMGRPWKVGDTVFHPKDHQDTPWIAGHASPGPLLPRSFIDLGGPKLVGIMNGRERTHLPGGATPHSDFTVGLFIYDYELGKIDWVSSEPMIKDTEAFNITFASQFVETKHGEGILYAHVDDSFVRAYTLYADGIRDLLPI